MTKQPPTVSKITYKRGLQFMEKFLVNEINLIDSLYEPSARVLGMIEAHKNSLKALENIMKRTIKETPKIADRSHVRLLSEND